MLRSFVPLFAMTFFICLFIVLMQFLWRYIDELVGKGLSINVIGELFFYAALTMVPLALPLAILLASLMTFGNLGENFELTAMKASGISLIRVMKPLTVLMVAIAIGAFFFQNDVLPVAQARMYTLLFSIRQKSPELEIPEGVFYDQIPGYNLFVKSKNRDTGTLYDIMIYDVSKGFDNAGVILADSGHLATSADNTHLVLTLWKGEQFENLRDTRFGSSLKQVPYRRESFSYKEILVPFDANFNRLDEQGMRNQYVGKNIAQLQATIDSVSHRIDSIGTGIGYDMQATNFFGVSNHANSGNTPGTSGPAQVTDGEVVVNKPQKRELLPDVKMDKPINIDSLFRGNSSAKALSYLNQALIKARRYQSDYQFKGLLMDDDRRSIRRHAIELQKKFTLSFACIIFFFIGAPLGAIIRKGGLGMPLVISVFLFIFYYIIDNTGYKLARDGKIEVWIGMWLSSAILLPLGIFFTYKAVKDSAVFNADAYRSAIRRLLGMRESRTALMMKEVRIEECEPQKAIEMINALKAEAAADETRLRKRPGYLSYLTRGLDFGDLRQISDRLENTVGYISNSTNLVLLNTASGWPTLPWLWIYRPLPRKWMGIVAAIIFPIGLGLYISALLARRRLLNDLHQIAVTPIPESLNDTTNEHD